MLPQNNLRESSLIPYSYINNIRNIKTDSILITSVYNSHYCLIIMSCKYVHNILMDPFCKLIHVGIESIGNSSVMFC